MHSKEFATCGERGAEGYQLHQREEAGGLSTHYQEQRGGVSGCEGVCEVRHGKGHPRYALEPCQDKRDEGQRGLLRHREGGGFVQDD